MRMILLWLLFLAAPSYAADNAAFEACRSKLRLAQKLEVLHAFRLDKGAEPYLVAGPTFFTLSIDAKEGFVETVNCFLAVGDSNKCINFDVLHWQTGKPVGRFENCRFKMH